uniref:EF-hand domain-containing protein n=1 Tax=Panagrellus redivivus TaxID=6233 RepID=A0A7E4VF80_PANRE
MSESTKNDSSGDSLNNDDSRESEGSTKKSKNPIKKMWSSLSRKMSFNEKHDKDHQPPAELPVPSSVKSIRQSFEPTSSAAALPPRPPVSTSPKKPASKPSLLNEVKIVTGPSPPKPPRSPCLSPPKPARTFKMATLPTTYNRNTMSSEMKTLFDVFSVYSSTETSVTLNRVPTIYRVAGLVPTEAQLKVILDGWKAEKKTEVDFDELTKGFQTLAANPDVKKCGVDNIVDLLECFVLDGHTGILEQELRFLLARGPEGLSDSEITQLINEVGVVNGEVNISDFARNICEGKSLS